LILALYPREELTKVTPGTISDRTTLMTKLKELSEADYAISRQESELGISAVAVLLAATSWRDRIAIVASIPLERATDEHLTNVAEKLKQSAVVLGPQPVARHPR
jgi:IclR family transcriptional regulator, acetate operon repressor